MIAFWSNVKLMYADYAIVSLFLIRFLARSIALAWQPKGWIISSGLNFSHSLYDFYPIGLYFPYKTRLPFYLWLHSILKWKKLRIAQVVYLGPHVRSPFWMFFLRDHGKLIDAPSLVDLNFVAATCRTFGHTMRFDATRLLALILPQRSVARIQTSLNSCDRSQRQKSVAATMIFTCHTMRSVAATCRRDVSPRFVASCVSALKKIN